MNPAALIRKARVATGLTLRGLADRAATSHSTLAAYESGAKIPSPITLTRVIEAAGYSLDSRLERRVRFDPGTGLARGDELIAALDLAQHFPAEVGDQLDAPVFPKPG